MNKPFVMITGATGGLGTAFSIECASRGYDFLLTDMTEEGCVFAESIANRYNVRAIYKTCDLTSEVERTALFESLEVEGIRLWGLINNAGMGYQGAFQSLTRQKILQIIRLNSEAAVDNVYNALNLRDETQKFMLINVCSLAAFYPMPYKSIYASSKRLLLDFTLSLAEEIGDFASVTALCPAGMPTNIDSTRSIAAQGLMGILTTIETGKVARQTVSYALKDKRIVIPGLFNRILRILGGLIPASLQTKMIGKHWREVMIALYPLRPHAAGKWNERKLPDAR